MARACRKRVLVLRDTQYKNLSHLRCSLPGFQPRRDTIESSIVGEVITALKQYNQNF